MSIIGSIALFIISIISVILSTGTVPPAIEPPALPEPVVAASEVVTDYTPASASTPFVPAGAYNVVYGETANAVTVDYNILDGDRECEVNAVYYNDGKAASGKRC